MSLLLSRKIGWIAGIVIFFLVGYAGAHDTYTESDPYQEAMEALARGETDKAYSLFERSVEEGIRVHDAYWEMGMIILERGTSYRIMRRALRLSPRIIEAFRAHLEDNPDDDWSWFRLGYVHELRSEAPRIREWEQAKEAFLIALELSPENTYYLLHLGYIHYRVNEHEEAIRVFLQALEIDPTYWKIRYYLAMSYLAMDQKDLARQELQMITGNLSPDVELFERVETALRKLGE